MNFKVLLTVFLCLFSVSIICNVAMRVLNAVDGWSCKAFTHAVHAGYLTTNRVEPTGDPIEGDGTWPY